MTATYCSTYFYKLSEEQLTLQFVTYKIKLITAANQMQFCDSIYIKCALFQISKKILNKLGNMPFILPYRSAYCRIVSSVCCPCWKTSRIIRMRNWFNTTIHSPISHFPILPHGTKYRYQSWVRTRSRTAVPAVPSSVVKFRSSLTRGMRLIKVSPRFV